MSHHVLVVEPDESIRALLTAILRRHHYEPVVVGSAAEAQVALSGGAPFCLAIVDCRPGEACAINDIAAARPDLPIAITATIPSQLRAMPSSIVQVLHKPYDIAMIDALAHAHCSKRDLHGVGN